MLGNLDKSSDYTGNDLAISIRMSFENRIKINEIIEYLNKKESKEKQFKS